MGSSNFTIVDITEGAMVQVAARLHIEAFAGYLNARFGTGYITSFINWFVHEKEAVALAAVDSQQRIIGYVMGVPIEIGHRPYRELQGLAVRSLVQRPWLFFDKRLWQAARSRCRALVRKEKGGDHYDIPKPTMGLVGIGVDSLYRRHGIAGHLMEAFQERAKRQEMRSLSTWVYMDNTSARRLYERCGWQPHMDSLTERGSVRYYKLIV